MIAPIHPTLPAVDLERALKFYEGTLGVKVLQKDPSPGAMVEAGEGTTFYIYQRAATKADHTVASFTVEDVEATVKELRGKGVEFLDLDQPGIKTVDGIASFDGVRVAWFKDTEGNILALGNM